jgi:hypothetical protein
MSAMMRRLGKCYELAGAFVVTHPDAVLVHGTIHREGLGPPNPHAWNVLADGTMREPITGWEMPKDAFDRFFGAVEQHRYTWKEMQQRMIETFHWGPWE